jgi:hypothetical protein
MKDVAHVAGKDWLGSMPEHGPAFYIGAEDDEDEIHIRLAAIAKHYGVTFEELIAGGFQVLNLLGKDATLCAATGKSGKVEVTHLYRKLREEAGDIKPKNISIDTLSRAFAGNEIDRVQVYAFAMYMQALAMVAGGSVTVLSHPSLTGVNPALVSLARPLGTAHFDSGSTSRASSPTVASSQTATCASWSSRRTNTARRPRPSCCAISAACFCLYPVSARWKGSRRSKRTMSCS